MQCNFSQVTCSLGKGSSIIHISGGHQIIFVVTKELLQETHRCLAEWAREPGNVLWQEARIRSQRKIDWRQILGEAVSALKMCCCFYLQRWHTSDRRARLSGIKGLLKPQTWLNTTKPLSQFSEPSTWGMSDAQGSFTFLFTGKKIHHAAITEV